MKAIVKKDINKEMQGEIGKDDSINWISKREAYLKLIGHRS
jgi:hypothetical protein